MQIRRAIALVAALSAACGGVAEVGESPSWRQNSGSESPREDRSTSSRDEPGAGEPEMLSLEVESLPADAYNAREAPAPSASDRARVTIDAIERAADRAGTDIPARDGRLDAAAAALAGVAPQRAPVPYPLIEFALQSQGIIEPSPHLVVLWGPPGDARGLAAELEDRLPPILESAPFARVGVGASERGESVATVIALQTSFVATEPIPRAMPDGGQIRVKGEVQGGYRHPEVYVTRDDGSVVTPPVSRAGSRAFRADVSCQGRRGAQQIEITARDEKGSTVLANFPVWCHDAPPTQVEVTTPGEDAMPASAEEAEQQIAELINRARERHDLPPLSVDVHVAEVARDHAEEMAETGVVAHVSPDTGSAADRIEAAGIDTPFVLENVARAYSVKEAHEGLMNSPGHRAGILHESVTHVGVGVALGQKTGGHREIFVGQVFTRNEGDPVDERAAAEMVHEEIQSERALIADPGLASVAQAYARELADGTPQDEAAAAATTRLSERGAAFADVSSVVAVVPNVEQFSARRALAGGDATHYAVGVAPVAEADRAPELAVVLLLARR